MRNHVMLVEDDEMSRDAWRLLLQATGHRVCTAGSVAEAIATARAERPDLVLLDLTLPDGDGLDIARTLLADAEPPIFVALTGHDSAEVAGRCREAGVASILLKPISTRELLAVVSPLLAARQ